MKGSGDGCGWGALGLGVPTPDLYRGGAGAGGPSLGDGFLGFNRWSGGLNGVFRLLMGEFRWQSLRWLSAEVCRGWCLVVAPLVEEM